MSADGEPWFGARDEACVDVILLAAAQGRMADAWALELKREARIDWELVQAREAANSQADA